MSKFLPFLIELNSCISICISHYAFIPQICLICIRKLCQQKGSQHSFRGNICLADNVHLPICVDHFVLSELWEGISIFAALLSCTDVLLCTVPEMSLSAPFSQRMVALLSHTCIILFYSPRNYSFSCYFQTLLQHRCSTIQQLLAYLI